jgi:hypothetical protein
MRASSTHRQRVGMVFPICGAATAVTNLSSASQGFCHSRGWPPVAGQSAVVTVHQGGGDSGGAPRLCVRKGGEGDDGGVSRRGLRLDGSRRPPWPGRGRVGLRPDQQLARGVVLPDVSPVGAPVVLDDAESNWEDFNVADDASVARVDLFDVDAVDSDALPCIGHRAAAWALMPRCLGERSRGGLSGVGEDGAMMV